MSKGQTVNRTQLANICGVNLTTIDKWYRQGCPYITKADRRAGKQWEFDTSAVLSWREESAIIELKMQYEGATPEQMTEAEADRRKSVAQAHKAELDLSKARGDLISIQDVTKEWSKVLSTFKAKLVSGPSRLAPILASENDLHTVTALLNDDVQDTLSELLQYSPQIEHKAE